MTPERRHPPVFPGFRDMAERRRAFVDGLVSKRLALGLTQTEVAARMGTSQSAVARLESCAADVRISTLERYAAALECSLELQLSAGTGHDRRPEGRGGRGGRVEREES